MREEARMNIYTDLDNETRDMLAELGNIGTGNAVSSLSAMMGHVIEIGIPSICLVRYQDIFDTLGIQEAVQTGILIQVSGELQGMFLFLIDEAFTKAILETMLGETDYCLTCLDEMGQSLLSELGNIMCGSYIRALAELTGMDTDVSVPDLCIDMGGAILGVPLSRHLKVSDSILLIENIFHMGENAFVGRILFWPELDSLNTMLKKLRE